MLYTTTVAPCAKYYKICIWDQSLTTKEKNAAIALGPPQSAGIIDEINPLKVEYYIMRLTMIKSRPLRVSDVLFMIICVRNVVGQNTILYGVPKRRLGLPEPHLHFRLFVGKYILLGQCHSNNKVTTNQIVNN